jgi:predicted negative regulator of RcsB-dependent stress response
MATHLDLEEQEQLDAAQGVLEAIRQPDHLGPHCLVLGTFAAWNGWNWWQRDQAMEAGAMFDELDKAVEAKRRRQGTVFADLKDATRAPSTPSRAVCWPPSCSTSKGQADAAKASLAWVADKAPDDEYKTWRVAPGGRAVRPKKYDEALKQLGRRHRQGLRGLVADRRGDILAGPEQARRGPAAYQAAWKGLDDQARLPAAGRSQAERPGRRAGGRCNERRRAASAGPASDLRHGGRFAGLCLPWLAVRPTSPSPRRWSPSRPIAGRQVWNQRVDSVQFPLAVAVNARHLHRGRHRRHRAGAAGRHRARGVARPGGAKLSAGVGSDGRYAAVVTVDNELVVLEAGPPSSGAAPRRACHHTAPLVAGERVFVLGSRPQRACLRRHRRPPLWTCSVPARR